MVSVEINMMNSLKPKVSLVVPVFNEAVHVLEQSLGSVASQTFMNFECLIIDESSDPYLASACRVLCDQDKRFRYIHPEKRLGLAESLNLGISLAQGELLARFDSDDICMPNRLMMQVDFLAAHPEVDVLGGCLEIISEDGDFIALRDYPADQARIERSFHTTTSIAHPTVMMRKCVITKFGAYDTSFLYAEDLDLWLRYLNKGVKFANLQEVLVRYRQEDTNRKKLHFRFNLRARIVNFRSSFILLRIIGILGIAIYCILPSSFQKFIFRGLLFQHE